RLPLCAAGGTAVVGSPSPCVRPFGQRVLLGKGFHPWKRSLLLGAAVRRRGLRLPGFGVAGAARNGSSRARRRQRRRPPCLGLVQLRRSPGSSAFSLTSTARRPPARPSPTTTPSSRRRQRRWRRRGEARGGGGGTEGGGAPARLHLQVHSRWRAGHLPAVGMAHPYESWFKPSHPGLGAGEVGSAGASSWWTWRRLIDVQSPNGAAALPGSLHPAAGGLQTSSTRHWAAQLGLLGWPLGLQQRRSSHLLTAPIPNPSGQSFVSRCPSKAGKHFRPRLALPFPPFSPSQTRGFRRDSWRWGSTSRSPARRHRHNRGRLLCGPARRLVPEHLGGARLAPLGSSPSPGRQRGRAESAPPLPAGEARPRSPRCSHPRGFSAVFLSFPGMFSSRLRFWPVSVSWGY
uniref:Sp8 transcription factor n=1 Tax=Malurus cyaneus samueli TaxID=2593467 RepID=A0A8C5TWE2_9PASS